MEDNDIALFSSRLKLNRLDETTLEILKRLLSSTEDDKELQNLRTDLVQFLRSKSLSIVRQSADKPVAFQLSTLDFFLSAFDILEDIQSRFSLRFERLVIRDSAAASHPHLHVSTDEWLNFAEDASEHDFFFLGAEACENAMSGLDRNGDGDHDNLLEKMTSIDGIDRLKDAALQSPSNHSSFLDTEDNILGIINEDVSDGYDSEMSEQNEEETGQGMSEQNEEETKNEEETGQGMSEKNEEETGQGKRKRKRRKTKKKKKNMGRGRKVGSFAIDTYVLEVFKELKEKKMFMVYTLIEILGLPAFHRLLQRVRDIQASGGQRTYSAERLKTGGGILWYLLQEENLHAYNFVAGRHIQLKTRCGVRD